MSWTGCGAGRSRARRTRRRARTSACRTTVARRVPRATRSRERRSPGTSAAARKAATARAAASAAAAATRPRARPRSAAGAASRDSCARRSDVGPNNLCSIPLCLYAVVAANLDGKKIGVASSISVITQTTTQSTTISNSPTTVIATVIVTVTPTYTREPETSTTTRTTTAGPTSTGTGALPPVRPTSSDDDDEPDPSSTTDAPEYCPTGFYACEASAGAGCCRTGRDCATTSCPPPSEYTTITNGDGVTVVAPVPTGTDAGDDQPEPQCASGWSLCPAEAGPIAGCCPDGYRCGTASCTLSQPDATATAQKQFPNAAGESRWAGSSGAGRWALALLLCAVVGFAGVA